MKVVINKKYYGITFSAKAIKKLVDINSSLVQKMNSKTFWGTEDDGSIVLPSIDWVSDLERSLVPKEGGMYSRMYQVLIVGDDWYSIRVDAHDDRTHPDLIWLVETLGKEVNTESIFSKGSEFDPYQELKIVEIPDDVDWEISGDFGEIIQEKHRIWE